MEMTIDFEKKFFQTLQDSVKDVKNDIKDLSKKVDRNTNMTQETRVQVDKLNGKVFGRKPASLANLFGDKQIIGAFVFALTVFLLIVASVLHVRIP